MTLPQPKAQQHQALSPLPLLLPPICRLPLGPWITIVEFLLYSTAVVPIPILPPHAASASSSSSSSASLIENEENEDVEHGPVHHRWRGRGDIITMTLLYDVPTVVEGTLGAALESIIHSHSPTDSSCYDYDDYDASTSTPSSSLHLSSSSSRLYALHNPLHHPFLWQCLMRRHIHPTAILSLRSDIPFLDSHQCIGVHDHHDQHHDSIQFYHPDDAATTTSTTSPNGDKEWHDTRDDDEHGNNEYDGSHYDCGHYEKEGHRDDYRSDEEEHSH